MWRAFVYDQHVPDDRAKQAYNEFQPLDGKFRPNVMVQIKNGPIDFQPREPFHPLFGAMPRTPLALELQITQEYLGARASISPILAPMWKECLDADTFAAGPGSTVARVIDGSLDHHAAHRPSPAWPTPATDRNWCGHPLAAANWYAFGRLAWDHDLGARTDRRGMDAHDLCQRSARGAPVTAMLLASREAVVDYMTPLGLHHLMATDHHYGPGPWVDNLAPRLESGLLPPRRCRRAWASTARRPAPTRWRNTRPSVAAALWRPGDLPREPAALVPPCAVGPPHEVRAARCGMSSACIISTASTPCAAGRPPGLRSGG